MSKIICNSDCDNCKDIECKSIEIKTLINIKWTKDLKIKMKKIFDNFDED